MGLKLITEQIEEVQVLVEEDTATKKKSYFIEGPYLQSQVRNRNKRWYPFEILEREVGRYTKDYIKENRAFGELGHPDTPAINLPLVSHMIKSLTREGNNFIGKSKILDTPNGLIVQNLLENNAKLGVSSRGMGTLIDKAHGAEVQEDFVLATPADIVADPSGPNCFVNGIMENREWWYDKTNGSWISELVEDTHKDLNKLSVKQLEEQAVPVFTRFMTLLSKGNKI